MFIKTTKAGYTRDGEQFAQGLFMLLVSHPEMRGKCPLRAIVRHVKFSQCGHFMMGNMIVGGYNLTLSGTYGSDGLPHHLDRHFIGIEGANAVFRPFLDEEKMELWNHLVEVPADLAERYWNGGGHNSAGPEGPFFKKWALDNIKLLKKRVPLLFRHK